MSVGRAEQPFVVVDVPKETCLLATSTTKNDRLVLRVKGETAPIVDSRGVIGRCAQTETTLLVTREGTGEVSVLAPAATVGGALGLREVTTNAGLSIAAIAITATDHAWDAKQLLLASAIPEAIITTAAAPDVALDADARIVALSLETPSALRPDTPPDVRSSCLPALDAKTPSAMCVFSGVQKWKSPGGGGVEAPIGGLARSKLPFWLFTMQGVKDPAALEGITKLLALARVLARQGFAPTTLEALIEQPLGVEVLGRTGEKMRWWRWASRRVTRGSTPSATTRPGPSTPRLSSRS